MSEKNSLNPGTLLEGLYSILKNNGEKPLEEKAVSKKQQKFMGMVRAAQKGETPASPEVAKVAKSMKKSDVKDFASTKRKGLPTKVSSDQKECMDEDEVMADEELSMFSRHNVGKRSGRGQGDNPWNRLKKRGRKFKSRTRYEESEIEECAGVGIITKQNSTQDVDSTTLDKNLAAFNLEEALNDMRETLVREGKLRKGTQQAIPNIQTWAGLDNNNSPYAAYRYGVALAGAPASTMDKNGSIGGKFVTIGYTEQDQAILNKAAQSMGVSSKPLGDEKSKELGDVNTKSAIASAKRNQYGV